MPGCKQPDQFRQLVPLRLAEICPFILGKQRQQVKRQSGNSPVVEYVSPARCRSWLGPWRWRGIAGIGWMVLAEPLTRSPPPRRPFGGRVANLPGGEIGPFLRWTATRPGASLAPIRLLGTSADRVSFQDFMDPVEVQVQPGQWCWLSRESVVNSWRFLISFQHEARCRSGLAGQVYQHDCFGTFRHFEVPLGLPWSRRCSCSTSGFATSS